MKFLPTIPLLPCLFAASLLAGEPVDRPNILFCIMDDASYPHMSAYETTWVETPAFDRLAAEGILFENAYVPNAKCGPSRAIVLTGRQSWQLRQIGVHLAVWPETEFMTWMEALSSNGYTAGFTGKGWGPGRVAGNPDRPITGKEYNEHVAPAPARFISGKHYSRNFRQFLDDQESDQPWAFWYGAHEPHRRYEYGVGARLAGKEPSDVEAVPRYWPDNEVVRNDMLDYAFEIEYADQHLGEMLKLLEERGQLDNTIIVMTADNGMPFPRSKGLQYEISNHMPLAIMWKDGIQNPGRVEHGYVSFVDFAPTFLAAAGVDLEAAGMEPSPGKDMREIFEDSYRKQDWSYVVLGQERHDYGRPENQGYPIRSIIQDGFLYMHNFKPELWPVGNPETGYLNTDGSPTKTAILNLRREGIDTQFWQINFGKNPQEQLFHIAVDPECLVNLADTPEYQSLKQAMKDKLFTDLARLQDPRVVGPDGDIFDSYPFDTKRAFDFYERYMAGEISDYQTNWVEPTDFEAAPIE